MYYTLGRLTCIILWVVDVYYTLGRLTVYYTLGRLTCIIHLVG